MFCNTIVAVRLTPKASVNRIGDMRKLPDGQEQLMVYVKAPANDGKANDAMMRLLAKHYGVAISRFKLVCGRTSRNKLVQIID